MCVVVWVLFSKFMARNISQGVLSQPWHSLTRAVDVDIIAETYCSRRSNVIMIVLLALYYNTSISSRRVEAALVFIYVGA